MGLEGREWYHLIASLWFPSTSSLRPSVYLLPFSSYFDGSQAFPPTRSPVRPVRYDNTVLEASLRRTAKTLQLFSIAELKIFNVLTFQ